MIQDIAPHHFDNAYRPAPPSPDSFALCFQERKSLLLRREDGSFDFPRFRDLEKGNEDIYQNSIYLFAVDGQPFYLLQNLSIPAPSGFSLENIQFFRSALPATWLLPELQGISSLSGMKAAAGAAGAVLLSSMMRKSG